jgi:hypothetical protein
MNELLTIAEEYRERGLDWEAAFWLSEAESYNEYP